MINKLTKKEVREKISRIKMSGSSLRQQGMKRHRLSEKLKITDEQRKIIHEFERAAGNTKMLELDLPIPNGNRIYAKCEFDNPVGTHYARVYPYLLRVMLEVGFTPDKYGLVETSSGNASIAFARVSRTLGYETWVVLPRPGEISETRINLTRNEGANIVHPDPRIDGYGLPGISNRMGRLIRESRKWDALPLWSPNHSMVSETIDSIRSIPEEIILGLSGYNLDYYIGIPGNGTTLYGIGAPLKVMYPTMKIIAVEPRSNPGLYLLKYGNKDYDPDELPNVEPSPQVHDYKITMPGTGVYGIAERFPHLNSAVPIVDSIRQIDDKSKEWEKPMYHGKSVNDLLYESHGIRVGYTSAASLMVALEISRRVRDKNFVIIFYDLLDGRY